LHRHLDLLGIPGQTLGGVLAQALEVFDRDRADEGLRRGLDRFRVEGFEAEGSPRCQRRGVYGSVDVVPGEQLVHVAHEGERDWRRFAVRHRVLGGGCERRRRRQRRRGGARSGSRRDGGLDRAAVCTGGQRDDQDGDGQESHPGQDTGSNSGYRSGRCWWRFDFPERPIGGRCGQRQKERGRKPTAGKPNSALDGGLSLVWPTPTPIWRGTSSICSRATRPRSANGLSLAWNAARFWFWTRAGVTRP